MRTRTTAAALTALLTLALTGCETGTSTTSGSAKDQSGTEQNDTAEDTATDAANEDATTDDTEVLETGNLPDMTGKGLQTAQDDAQAAGFFLLTSHDALGRDRMQAMDRNWKVCTQTPTAGEHSTDTQVDFGAVKLEEDCPTGDVEAPVAADSTMPDFTGKAVNVARDALDSSTSITVEDVSGQDRMIFMESNWQVCSQEPAAGAALDGQPVTFGVVKFEESC
ncbi:hypothetical protein ACFXAZ_21820 [Streptomyces sp. NPDC059477]|uniref:hypothetical protein n=1 Tax=Streptomyces sp. NPDC059477 TaxID=3346847 RepID=UPI0036A058D8